MPEAYSYADAFYSVAPSNAVVFHSTGTFNYNELYVITFSMAMHETSRKPTSIIRR